MYFINIVMSVPLVVATCLLHYSKYIALIMLIQGRFRLDLRTVFLIVVGYNKGWSGM